MKRMRHFAGVLIMLALLCGVRASAQRPDGFDIIVTSSGDITGTMTDPTDQTGQNHFQRLPWLIPVHNTDGSWTAGRQTYGGTGVYWNLSLKDTGTVTITVYWHSDAGNPPPPKEFLRIQPTVSWQANASKPFNMSGHTADNGFGDTEAVVEVDPTKHSGSCNQYHLIQLDTRSGTATKSISITSALAFTGPQSLGSYTISALVRVYEDNRAINISSTLDPTFQRVFMNGVPTRAINSRDSDGNLRADVYPASDLINGFPVNYEGNRVGTWHAGMEFHWNDSLTGQSFGGTLPLTGGVVPDIPTFGVVYRSLSPDGAFTHVFLSAIDVNYDNARCTSNYNLYFHRKYEDWSHNVGSPVIHPIGTPGTSSD